MTAAEAAPVVLRSHYAPDGTVEGIEVLEAPQLSLITRELFAELDPRFRDPNDSDVLVFTADVRYRVGDLCGPWGDRLLHRLPE